MKISKSIRHEVGECTNLYPTASQRAISSPLSRAKSRLRNELSIFRTPTALESNSSQGVKTQQRVDPMRLLKSNCV